MILQEVLFGFRFHGELLHGSNNKDKLTWLHATLSQSFRAFGFKFFSSVPPTAVFEKHEAALPSKTSVTAALSALLRAVADDAVLVPMTVFLPP